MNPNRIHTALDAVCADEQAQARMYRHILKKRQLSRQRLLRNTLAPIAACLVLIIGALADWDHRKPPAPPRPTRPAVCISSPVCSVPSAEEFAPAGVRAEAPAEAEDVRYTLISQEIARIDFTWNGVSYVLLASAVRSDDFSMLENSDSEEFPLSGAFTLNRIDGSVWKAEYAEGGLRVFLINHQGASLADMQALTGMISVQKRTD